MTMGVTVKYLPPGVLRGATESPAHWVPYLGSEKAVGNYQQVRGNLSRSERKSQGGGIGGDWVAGDKLESCIDARIDEYFDGPIDYRKADKAVHLEQKRLGGKNWRNACRRPDEPGRTDRGIDGIPRRMRKRKGGKHGTE